MAISSRAGATEAVTCDRSLEAAAPPSSLHDARNGPTIGIGSSYRPFTAPRRLE
jgi:hypothetical protein